MNVCVWYRNLDDLKEELGLTTLEEMRRQQRLSLIFKVLNFFLKRRQDKDILQFLGALRALLNVIATL